MPQLQPEQLVKAITDAIAASGYAGNLASPIGRHPRRFVVAGPNAPTAISVYVWTLTFGGRDSLPDEYRIQLTADPPLIFASDGPT
ncbi:MAG: hypothetical protein ACRELF_21075, partial [Gemmataceae bacterium]